MALNPVQRWLQSVLGPYTHRQQVFTDVDRTLQAVATLLPKTDTYTYDDGRTLLLLTLHGTIPITFRGNSYNIPVQYWIPHAFPKDPPIVYVVPTANMLVRPSRTVDVSGLCRGDYLEGWARKSEGCNLLHLTEALQHVFSREPPLYAKPASPAQPPASSSSSSNREGPTPRVGRPPPPPPIQPNVGATANGATSTPSPSPGPLPPKPPIHRMSRELTPQSPRSPVSPSASAPAPQRPPRPQSYQNTGSMTAHMPGQAPFALQHPAQHMAFQHPEHSQHQNGHVVRTLSPGPMHGPPPSQSYGPNGQIPQHMPVPSSQHAHPPYMPPRPDALRPASMASSSTAAQAPHRSFSTPVNILDGDDDPDSNGMSQANSSKAPPPPRPTNPELLNMRRALFAQLNYHLSSLQAHLHQENEQLRALHQDLLQGEPAIRDEMARLEAVRDVCLSVKDRMSDIVAQADRNIHELQAKPDPEVDELICGTNVVHNQLLDLVAEDNALEDTVYHLGRAFNADTRSPEELEKFLKRTRALAREQFMRRSLINKILLDIALARAQR